MERTEAYTGADMVASSVGKHRTGSWSEVWYVGEEAAARRANTTRCGAEKLRKRKYALRLSV